MPPTDRTRDHSAPAGLERDAQSDVSVTAPLDARGDHEDTLLERNIVYDRLMSGQETETGEHPPSYGEALQSAQGESRSVSRGPRGRSMHDT